MFNSALEQFEIVPFLSFALPKIGNASLFTQSFDLPNSLLSFIFAIFFLLSINKVLNSIRLKINWASYLFNVGDKKPNPYDVPSAIWLRIFKLIEMLNALSRRIDRNGKYSPEDREKMKYILKELLFLHRRYRCLTPQIAKELKRALDILTK